MKNIIFCLLTLSAMLICSDASAQASKKVWVEAGKSAFLVIPASEKGKASKETTTDTYEVAHENSTIKMIGRRNPDGKIVSIEIIPQTRMQLRLNGAPTTDGYINECCAMCPRVGGDWLCCWWCKILAL